ncbi:MAG: SDR family oxidoreductase [Sphingomonadales bacterium]|nr:SDR family oxidoreductase [Sphingomonadales bacterium]
MTGVNELTSYWAKTPVALVIGCGGMGTAIARVLGRRQPLLMVDIDAAKLIDTVEALRLDGHAVTGLYCDITDAGQLRALDGKLAELGGVRALAHVAAVGKSIGSWRRMLEIDLLGAVHVAATVTPHMVPGSAAVFISSLASYLPPADAKVDALLDDPLAPGFLDALAAYHGTEPDFDWAYNYAKLGVNRLAERMAREWQGREARSLSLSPGMIDSPMARAEGDTLPAHDGTQARVTRADKAREIPLLREGSLQEITSVVEFLLSDGASFLNGIDVVVDGGHRAVWRAQGIISR